MNKGGDSYLPLVGRSDRRSGWGRRRTPAPLLRSDPPHKGEGKAHGIN
ncbi:hypothetical protein MesoLj113a_01670 [Mesorhizobium sp. 113-1-2]|nr:hypothetical protein MesoLj113a_01670 [Mesorhizobium sp. 113-1-2]